jgi:dihydropteroate synthase
VTGTYLRPTGFVDAPFGHDGKVARLAGGLQYFASVEIIRDDGADLVPVAGIEDRLGEAERTVWQRLTSPRAPLKLGERVVRLDQPQVMGIVNVTPDSFSDGGDHADPEAAIAAGHDMAAAGAAIVDVGGESTRPGAKPVWEGDEAARVLPVIQRLAASGTAISVDTRNASVMGQALAAGAGMVNDVSALTWDPRSAETLAGSDCPVVLMHHAGPGETSRTARYDWLEARIEAAVAAGIDRSRLIVDPGLGAGSFGKTVAHNLELLNGLALLHGLGCPILVGASRKTFIGALANEAPVGERLGGSLAAALQAAGQGVQLLRVHDVPETLQALRVWRGLRDAALTPPL